MTMTSAEQTEAFAGNATPGHFPKPRAAVKSGVIELLFVLSLAAAALIYGWQQRNEGELTAETGTGYYLGIIGSVMMLMLLLYPLRKRVPALRTLGSVRVWFRVHMIFGIAGPTLIVLHSNYSFTSLNSTIAFLSMMVVAISGLVGRFLYARIHRGLYGRRASAREYLGDAESFKTAFGLELDVGGEVLHLLKDYEARRLAPATTLLAGLGGTLSSPFAQRRCRRQVLRAIGKKTGGRRPRTFDRNLRRYLDAIARAEAFAFYERLFALWHILHLPLFILLLLAAPLHIIAVHLY